MRREVNRSWWYTTIRGIQMWVYRNWFVVWLLFLLALVLWYFLCYRPYCEKISNCCRNTIYNQKLDSLIALQDSCCFPKYIPRKNCRVHFSGGFMGGVADPNIGISKIYEIDFLSEYVGEGDYPQNEKAFPKAVATTFDGIAIDKGTRLIIYSKSNYKGEVLLDAVGPKIILNVKWKNDSRYNHCINDVFPPDLEQNYPRSVRMWSSKNMHNWSFGSCRIICGQ